MARRTMALRTVALRTMALRTMALRTNTQTTWCKGRYKKRRPVEWRLALQVV
jgi:hypothetical protein